MTSIESASAQPEAWLKLDRDGRTLAVGGAWTIAEAARLDRELDGLELSGGELAIDGTEISRLDSAEHGCCCAPARLWNRRAARFRASTCRNCTSR